MKYQIGNTEKQSLRMAAQVRRLCEFLGFLEDVRLEIEYLPSRLERVELMQMVLAPFGELMNLRSVSLKYWWRGCEDLVRGMERRISERYASGDMVRYEP